MTTEATRFILGVPTQRRTIKSGQSTEMVLNPLRDARVSVSENEVGDYYYSDVSYVRARWQEMLARVLTFHELKSWKVLDSARLHTGEKFRAGGPLHYVVVERLRDDK